MSHNISASVKLFTAAMPLNLADTIFRLCLDHYRFYYLFTPSRQVLRKRDAKGDQDQKKKTADFDVNVLEFAYACGRFFDEDGDLSWISEDGSLFCSLCGSELPAYLESLATWIESDFILIDNKKHKLMLWNPNKKAQQWLDDYLPRRPVYGVEGPGSPVLCLREWHSKDKREKYIQYVAIITEKHDEKTGIEG